MDPILIFMIYRMLIVLGGILCIYLGYRLFYVVQDKQGEFKIKYGEDAELHLSEVAPGVFFAVFGAAILAASLINNVKADIIPLANFVLSQTNSTTASADKTGTIDEVESDQKRKSVQEDFMKRFSPQHYWYQDPPEKSEIHLEGSVKWPCTTEFDIGCKPNGT